MADGAAITQNRTKIQPKKLRAALLLAEDELTDEAIAAEVSISRRQLAAWKTEPEFAALVGDHVGRIQAGMLRLAIAKKYKRLAVLDDLHSKTLDVIAGRAARYRAELGTDDTETLAAQSARQIFTDETTPLEAATGLLVRQETANNAGKVTVNWSVDTGLLKEIRALHEQAAKELGQWVDRSASEVTTNVVQIVGIDADDL